MQKYKIIRDAVHPHVLSVAKLSMLITKDNQYYLNNVSFEDKNYFSDKEPVKDNCWPIYASPTNEAMMVGLLPAIEHATGKRLFPTYSYGRIYWTGSTMKKHKDRPSCEYSVSLCVDADPEPWAIWFETEAVYLNPGDLVIYKGMEVEHWREEYTGSQQIQLFFHYVDADGPHANCRFDYRPMLGLPGK
jgi:hypothetical protein